MLRFLRYLMMFEGRLTVQSGSGFVGAGEPLEKGYVPNKRYKAESFLEEKASW